MTMIKVLVLAVLCTMDYATYESMKAQYEEIIATGTQAEADRAESALKELGLRFAGDSQ